MKASAGWPVVVVALAAVLPAGGALGVEPLEAFLEALRGRKYYDEAVDYLEQQKANTQLAEPLRERIVYDQAVTLSGAAADHGDPQVRETRLSRAAQLFEEFRAAHSNHPLAPSARSQLAGIMFERGRGKLLAADPSADDAAAARKLLEEARSQFASAEKDLDVELAKLPKLIAPEDQAQQVLKRQLSGDLAQARLWRASVDYELSKTFKPASAEAKKHLGDAAKNFAALYESYRTRAAGLLARLWEGRCYQALGQFDKALGCYRELIDLPDSDESRAIRTKSTRHALECWTHENVRQFQAAIERGQRWQQESGASATDADALAIRYLVGLAYERQSQALPDKDPNRKKLAGFAREHVVPVAQQPGEYQRPAKLLLVALSGESDAKDQKDAKRPRSTKRGPSAKGKDAPDKDATEPRSTKFAEIFEKAREALARMQDAATALAEGGAKADREKLQKQKDAAAAEAIELLRSCLALADKDTPPDDLNSARYYLCYACWDLGRYADALVLGEFLANHVPDSLPGRQGARLAMAAAVRLYGETDEADKSFEIAQVQRIAEMTFRRWPDQPEAEEAALTLVNFAAADQQVDKAMQYLDKIPADSPRRGQAELRAGQALWSSYLRALRLADEDRPPPDKLDALKNQARELFTKGVGRVEKTGPIDATLVSAVFSLAQLEVDAGHPDKAISWLENSKYGPLTLVKSGHAAAARPGFAIETYRMALLAYVAVTPQQLKKAEETMDALDKLVQGTGDAKTAENLTAIYISLGHQLQEQLQELRKSNKTKELDAVSQAFEKFLDRVIEREAGGSFASLNWVAATYYSLGAGFDDEGSAASPRATEYFDKATIAYQRVLEAAEKDPKYKEQPDALVALRLRLADCYGRAGKYDNAIKTISQVLEEKPMLLSAQVQAAKTYQSQGAKDPKAYATAIMGGLPTKDGRNRVWGWAKISKMTMSNPKFEETFHDSRLAIVESRYRYAHAQKDPARRTSVLEAAVQDLWSTYKLRPDLGGPETTARYDRSLKMLQKALGQPENGLEEFKKRDAETAAATPK
jgi:tetratricopeptide (TPR) repeat protein